MTGIERLREFADGISPFTVVCGVTTTSYDRKHTEVEGVRLREFLSDIADQTEREHACDADTIENIRLIVGRVIDDMERHVSGVEGAEDSHVARWARELREALGGDGRKPANYASISAYDLRPEEDREAIAWVRERGGLDAVKRRWECLSYYADPVPRACMEKRLARLQRQIDESHAALRRRREVISELNRRACDLTRENAELRKRAMPEGMCWPVFEDSEPVRVGDFVGDVEVRSVVFRDDGILLSDCTSVPGWGTWRSYKEPIKRPTPKVLDADGAEIRVGDTVYDNELGIKATVTFVHEGIIDPDFPDHVIRCKLDDDKDYDSHMFKPSQLTHRGPVLAADGKPLEAGQTVYAKNYGYVKCTVLAIEWVVDGYLVEVENEGGHKFRQTPDEFTHERPESKCRDCAHWQKDPTADKMGVCWFFYHEYEGQDCYAARRADIGACEEFMPKGKELEGDA